MHLTEIVDKMIYLSARGLRTVSDPIFLEDINMQLQSIHRIRW